MCIRDSANVPPNCFMPRPKVGSAVIRLTRHAETPVQVDDEKLLFQIIRASFNQRRKTLANGLKNYEGLSFEKETIAVSYTHLDVYKRQELKIPIRKRGANRITPQASSVYRIAITLMVSQDWNTRCV